MKINTDTIIIDPNPLLRKKAKPVKTPLSKEDHKLIMAMRTYVHDSKIEEIAEKEKLKAAVGLAAPQIGILKQLCVVEIEQINEKDELVVVEYALANPKIVAHSPQWCALSTGEGCLSVEKEIPGYVHRHLRVRIHAFDCISNQPVEIKANGYIGVVLQHEIDHLNGILFYDHINQKDPWKLKENTKLID